KAPATVRGVIGECYWKVSIGEMVGTADFIAPPRMLSREVSLGDGGQAKEVNWSLGDYLTPAEVQKAFSLTTPLPQPRGIGAIQPFPYPTVYKLGALFVVALIALGIVMALFP